VPHWLEKVVVLLQAETGDLRELARIAGADPRIFYRGVDLHDLDLGGQDIEGMEFSHPSHRQDMTGYQLDLDVYLPDDIRRPENTAAEIKSASRQEERAAWLLGEFLRNRSRALQIIEKYTNDKANLTNSALNVLRDVWMKEVQGKRFSNLQIARKVSGCFAKAEDKRSILAYYFARHLPLNLEIRNWLRDKSVSKLNPEQVKEFRRLVGAPSYAEARQYRFLE
jgi:hypothetical protein